MSRFHRFWWRQKIDIVVMEARPKKFVWLSFYLEPSLRNNHISHELILYVLQELGGQHLIDPLREARTFFLAAKRYNWSAKGKSRFFEGCMSFQVDGDDADTSMYPMLKQIVRHKIQKKQPHLRTFSSPVQAREAVRFISEIMD